MDGHLPLQDKDRDRFGVEPTLRGSNWRGKDCDDSNKDFYPGRRPIDNDREMDSNCNGIYVSSTLGTCCIQVTICYFLVENHAFYC